MQLDRQALLGTKEMHEIYNVINAQNMQLVIFLLIIMNIFLTKNYWPTDDNDLLYTNHVHTWSSFSRSQWILIWLNHFWSSTILLTYVINAQNIQSVIFLSIIMKIFLIENYWPTEQLTDNDLLYTNHVYLTVKWILSKKKLITS